MEPGTLPLEQYLDIELDAEEELEWLRKGREAKFYQLKREEYNRKLAEVYKPKVYSWGDLMAAFKRKWDVDVENMYVIEQLCKYFSGGEGFDGNPKKGLLLAGGVGTGKSTMMHFFKSNQVASYRMVSCRDIESDFNSEGDKSLRNCSYNQKISINSNEFGHNELGFCFDDLGTENNAKHYGVEKNVMADIILNRYDNQLPYVCTHITTNISAAEIRDFYGARVHDRMREMMNIIPFPVDAKSRRK